MFLKTLLSISIGFGLGVLREYLTINYLISVTDRLPRLGAIATWSIGHLDLFVIYALAKMDNPYFFFGYIYGETFLAYLVIKRRKDASK